ncbi:hypothetical protein NL50_17460 [Clostridium acetobutylicum]|nr:hypothetical protein NL50_17460 [Clostridium acetobutylicum]
MECRIFGRIDIISNNGECVSLNHELNSIHDESILEHANAIVKALGDGWKIYKNTSDGVIKIGYKGYKNDKALRSLELEVPKAPTISDAWLTTVEIEEEYGLPKGSVRRDIHRGKFQESYIKKIGRDWTVRMDAANRQYDKK